MINLAVMSKPVAIKPEVREFLMELAEQAGVSELARAIDAGARPQAGGLTPPAQSLLAIWLHVLAKRPVWLLVADNAAAEERCRELAFFQTMLHHSSEPPLVMPAWEHDPYEGLAPHEDIQERQALALWRAASDSAALVVAPAVAMMLRLGPPADYRALGQSLRRGERLELGTLIEHLRRIGYRQSELVEMPGQFARRGGLLDVFPPEADWPLRLEFFDNEIESLRHFDPATQRSTQAVEQAVLAPLAAGVGGGEEAGLAVGWAGLRLETGAPASYSFFDLNPRAFVLVSDPEAVAAEWRRWWERLERRYPGTRDLAKTAGLHAPAPDDLFYSPAEMAECISAVAGAELRELEYTANSAISWAPPVKAPSERTEAEEDGFLELEADAILLRAESGGRGSEMQARLHSRRDADSPPPGPSHSAASDAQAVAGHPSHAIERVDRAPVFSFSTRPAPRPAGGLDRMLEELHRRLDRGDRVLLATANIGELERLSDLLLENNLPFQLGMRPEGGAEWLAEKAHTRPVTPAPLLVAGALAHGLEWRSAEGATLIWGNADLLRREPAPPQPPRPRSRLGAFLGDFSDLKPGDFVVHVEHGIACYRGLAKMPAAAGGPESEFMLLEYAEGAKLYLPLTRMDQVQKYRSGDGVHPPLDRLGSTQWMQRKNRVKRAMRDMTDELLKLYAARQTARIEPCGPDTHWQREFEDAFPYTLTEDQERAIEDVRRDLRQPRPMDRLLVGDVGYGKTEVAMRAACKLVSEGRQAAVLAPTTVLAFQHFETFRNRFAAFPVRIELLSRFRARADQAAVLAALAAGKVDIVIGTHRLLSKDVRFQRLGLLVVDEEQRFGVRHKERLKQLKQEVHVLALSATPIPRTLNMSLAGLRDLSVIETPPKDRLAIQTVVASWSEDLVRQALETELQRGGQVFYIHNRVSSIWETAARLQELAPAARIAVAHGQLDGGKHGGRAAAARRLAPASLTSRGGDHDSPRQASEDLPHPTSGRARPGRPPASEAELERVMLRFIRHQADILVSTSIVENGLDIPLANTILIERADMFGLSELYQLRGRVGRSNRRAYAYLLAPLLNELSPLARKRLAAMREFSDLGAGFKIAALDLELRGAGNLLGAEQSGHIEAVGFDLYLRMLEQTVRERRGETPAESEETPVQIQLGVEIGIPESYIAGETQRLRMYKRIAEADSDAAREDVERELADRFGSPPAPVHHLLAYAAIKAECLRLGIRVLERRREQLVLQFKSEAGAELDRRRLADLVARTKGAQLSPQGVLKLPFRGESAESVLKTVRTLLTRLRAPIAAAG